MIPALAVLKVQSRETAPVWLIVRDCIHWLLCLTMTRSLQLLLMQCFNAAISSSSALSMSSKGAHGSGCAMRRWRRARRRTWRT